MKKLTKSKFSPDIFPGAQDWATIRFDNSLKVFWEEKEIDFTEPVKFLKETIKKRKCCSVYIWFVVVLRHDTPDKPLEIPLDLLCLSEEQRAEILEQKLVPKSYFKTAPDRLQGYYLDAEE